MNGTPSAALIREANHYMEVTARRFRGILGDVVSLEDLRGFSGLGVARALKEWDGTGQFGPFALQRARWGVVDGLRKIARQQGKSDLRDEMLATASVFRAAESATLDDPEEPSLVGKLLQEAAGAFDVELAAGAVEELPAPEEAVEEDSERMRVRRAVEALPEPGKQVIERHYYLGQTFKEIAQIMGIQRSTVFDIHKRAVRSLWQRFADAAGVPG